MKWAVLLLAGSCISEAQIRRNSARADLFFECKTRYRDLMDARYAAELAAWHACGASCEGAPAPMPPTETEVMHATADCYNLYGRTLPVQKPAVSNAVKPTAPFDGNYP